MNICALAGGVGGAKLLVGLARAVPPEDLTTVVNTGDDISIYGVHVSPDVDIVTYWLAGLADTERGWGLRGDTFHLVDALAALGEETWFRLGDRDFATCLLRTRLLREGATLSTAIAELRTRLGIATDILPMSDEPVRTRMHTTDGRALDFQEYFVRERHEPEIGRVELLGIESAKPAPGVIESIAAADLVVLCPSNPVVSIGPILAVSGVRNALVAHPRVIAVTPIVRGAALKGPADRLLRTIGADVSAHGVAALYEDFCDAFVVDASDRDEVDLVGGMKAIALDTIMDSPEASERLARRLLAL